MKPQLKRLTSEYIIKPFNCNDADLNGFLLESDCNIPNAKQHTVELLAVTYLIEDLDADATIAYFSLLNDKIEREITSKSAWNRLSRNLPNVVLIFVRVEKAKALQPGLHCDLFQVVY